MYLYHQPQLCRQNGLSSVRGISGESRRRRRQRYSRQDYQPGGDSAIRKGIVPKVRKTWQEKLADDNDLPKVVEITDKMSKRWGAGTPLS